MYTVSTSRRAQVSLLGPYELKPNPKALIRLSLGTAVTIAGLLCLPDAIAILPYSANPMVWLLRIAGLWMSAMFLWAYSFTVMVVVGSFLTGGIVVSDDGLKLWRFGRLIKWSNITAIAIESQPMFSRAFFMPPDVRRLTIYEQPALQDVASRISKLAGGGGLVPHHIPSFLFTQEEFESLICLVCEQSKLPVPNSSEVVLGGQLERGILRPIFERQRWLRVLMSVVIAAGVVSFLGRKAMLNYNFNIAHIAFTKQDYAAAEELYARAVGVDRTFAPAWDSLARSEFRQGKVGEAEEHWKMALRMKPDLVESKIGLAAVHTRRSEYAEARALLLQAVKLAPRYTAAYLNLADLEFRQGNFRSAAEIAQGILKQYPGQPNAQIIYNKATARLAEVNGTGEAR